MEKGLRECCRSVRIGKMLLVRDEDTGERHVSYIIVILKYFKLAGYKGILKDIKFLKIDLCEMFFSIFGILLNFNHSFILSL